MNRQEKIDFILGYVGSEHCKGDVKAWVIELLKDETREAWLASEHRIINEDSGKHGDSFYEWWEKRNNSEPELKPCPFCGSGVEINYTIAGIRVIKHPEGSNCSIGLAHKSEKELIAMWNKRAEP